VALTTVEANKIHEGAQAAQLVVDQLKPVLDRLNILYDSEGGLKTTITQENMDELPSLSGMTKQQLDAGMYALTGTLRTKIDEAYTALVELAARA
jgi:hypothetical protein